MMQVMWTVIEVTMNSKLFFPSVFKLVPAMGPKSRGVVNEQYPQQAYQAAHEEHRGLRTGQAAGSIL